MMSLSMGMMLPALLALSRAAGGHRNISGGDATLARSAQLRSPVWHVAEPHALGSGGGGAHSAAIDEALRAAGAAVRVHGHRTATVQLSAGRYELTSGLELPSGVSLRGATTGGDGATVLSGGVRITGWQPDHQTGRSWLWRAPLPPVLRGSFHEVDAVHGPANSTMDNAIRQLWVGGQRRGVARSLPMRFEQSLPAGLVAKPGQLRQRYNTTALRAVAYQHWTAASRPSGTPVAPGAGDAGLLRYDVQRYHQRWRQQYEQEPDVYGQLSLCDLPRHPLVSNTADGSCHHNANGGTDRILHRRVR